MLKGYWLVFVLLLVYAHQVDVEGGAYHRPLSEFRDSHPEWVGYAMFSVLLLFGLQTVATALRADFATDGLHYFSVTALLSIVAITRSDGGLHNLCAALAMVIMYFYLATLLYDKGLYSLSAMHMVVPIAILIATRAQSYGIWQKVIIVYFLTATVVQNEFWLREIRRQAVSTTRVRRSMRDNVITLGSALSAVIQQLAQAAWPRRYLGESFADFLQGIEWSRKPTPNPDIPFRPKTRRHDRGSKTAQKSGDQLERQRARRRKLVPLQGESNDRIGVDDDFEWLDEARR